MPRKRMIDPQIWVSEQFAGVSVLQRLLFIGLFSVADDEGRLKGSSAYIKSIIFPYDSITAQVIEQGLKRLSEVGLICLYTVEDLQYLHLPSWSKHQYIREPRPSKIPTPTCTHTPTCTYTQHQDNTKQHNPIQENTIQQETAKDRFSSIELLLSVGIAQNVAIDLSEQYDLKRIRQVTTYCKDRRNPAGAVISALRKGWAV